MAVDLPAIAAILFTLTSVVFLFITGRLRPKNSPPVVREHGWLPGLGNLYGFVSGPRGPLDFDLGALGHLRLERERPETGPRSLLVGQLKGLPLPPPPLVQRHRLLPSLCRRDFRLSPDPAHPASHGQIWRETLRAIVPRQQCADEVPHWQAFEAMPDEGFVPVREVGESAQRRPS